MPSSVSIQPAVAVTEKIGSLPAVPIMDDAMRRPGPLKPPDIPAVALRRHPLARPVGAIASGLDIPVMNMKGIGPVDGLLEVEGQMLDCHGCARR